MNKCRRCANKTIVSREDIDKAVIQLQNMKGIKLVNDDILNKRISECKECRYFEYNSTCMLCGCLVEIRGRLKDGKCPYPKHNKWLNL